MNKLNSAQEEQLKEIGTYLRQKRLESSLSLDQIATRTHIRASQLQAIEEGKIDGIALAQKLASTVEKKASIPAPAPAPMVTESTTDLNLPSPNKLKIYSLYLLLMLGAITGLIFFTRNFKSTSENAVAPDSKAAVTQLEVTPQPPVTPKPIDGLSITLTLEDDSWLRIKVDGSTKFEGILEKGTTKTWTGKEKLDIRAGNAGAVKLSLNQKPPQVLGKLGQVQDITITKDSKEFN